MRNLLALGLYIFLQIKCGKSNQNFKDLRRFITFFTLPLNPPNRNSVVNGSGEGGGGYAVVWDIKPAHLSNFCHHKTIQNSQMDRQGEELEVQHDYCNYNKGKFGVDIIAPSCRKDETNVCVTGGDKPSLQTPTPFPFHPSNLPPNDFWIEDNPIQSHCFVYYGKSVLWCKH